MADTLRPYRAAARKVYAAMWTVRGDADERWRWDDFTPYLDVYEQRPVAGQLR